MPPLFLLVFSPPRNQTFPVAQDWQRNRSSRDRPSYSWPRKALYKYLVLPTLFILLSPCTNPVLRLVRSPQKAELCTINSMPSHIKLSCHV